MLSQADPGPIRDTLLPGWPASLVVGTSGVGRSPFSLGYGRDVASMVEATPHPLRPQRALMMSATSGLMQ